MKKEIRDSYKCILSLTKEFFPEKIPLIWESMKGKGRKSNNALSNLISKVKGANITLAVNVLSEVQNKDIAKLFLISTMKSFDKELPSEYLPYNDIKNSINLENSIPYLAYYAYIENIDDCIMLMSFIEEFQKNSSIEAESDKSDKLLILIEQLKLDNNKLKVKNKELSTQVKEAKSEISTYKKRLDEQEIIKSDYERKHIQLTEELTVLEEYVKKQDETIIKEKNKNKQYSIEIQDLKICNKSLIAKIDAYEEAKIENNKHNKPVVAHIDDLLESINLEDEITIEAIVENQNLALEHIESQEIESNDEIVVIEAIKEKSNEIFLFGKDRGLTKTNNYNFVVIERINYKISNVTELLNTESLVYIVLTEIPADFKFEVTKLKDDRKEDSNLKIFKDKQELLNYIKQGD